MALAQHCEIVILYVCLTYPLRCDSPPLYCTGNLQMLWLLCGNTTSADVKPEPDSKTTSTRDGARLEAGLHKTLHVNIMDEFCCLGSLHASGQVRA